MEAACYAYHYRYDLYLDSFDIVLDILLERFVYVLYVVNCFQCVEVRGVLTLYEL